MKSLSTEGKFSYRELLYKALIFIVTTTVIVYFLPREGKFNYQFDINKPWKYGLLQASFDFPIYKPDAQIRREQDSIMVYYRPYYQLDRSVSEKMIQKFKADYAHHLHSILQPVYLVYIERTLERIYDQGILSSGELERLRNDSVLGIQLFENTTSQELSLEEVFTIKQAYETLINSDTLHYSRALLQRCNLNNYLVPNLTYDKEKSEASKKDLLSEVSWANGFVMNGQRIIDRGEIINARTFAILKSLEKEWDKRGETLMEKRLTLGGQVIFVSILIICFFIYLELFRHNYYERKQCLYLLFSLIIVFTVVPSLLVSHDLISMYVLPFVFLPMVVGIFLDHRTAFMTHIVTILLCSIYMPAPYEFLLLQTTAGMASIYSLRELSQRSQLFRSAFIVTCVYGLTYLAIDLVHATSLEQLNSRVYIDLVLNGVLLLFTYPLLLILEKIFGFTSNVTLVELSNINNKLLRELSEVAPGTFQHSLQVANLAAAAANSIGGNSQLVRTGAMYHDIGKMLNPAFFTENQSGVNPHEHLSCKQSAQIVISHVTDGLKLADKYHLPQVIKDFITTHHGHGLAKYFYISYQNEHPDEVVDKEAFRYPGPNPFSKEQAVLMMSDSVEAASRSLKEYTEESISGLVDKIVDSQVQEGYFKECPITFKDIATVKAVFKEKLRIMYHTRVSYPELKK